MVLIQVIQLHYFDYFFALLVYNYTIFYAVNIKLGKMYIHKVLLHIVPLHVCKK